MHICHINLASGFRGGERQTQLLIEGLATRNIRQTLVCRKGGVLAEKTRGIENLTIEEISKPFILGVGKTKRCDLIHAHEGRSCHYAYLSHLLTKIPYIITRRIPNLPKKSFPTTQVYKKARRIVALSNAIKSNLLSYQSSFLIDIIPSMHSNLKFDSDNASRLKAKYKNKIIVGHVGALVKHHKGQQFIIEAARLLQHDYPDLHFLLLGQGKDEKRLREQAVGLSNIEFVGFVDNVGDYLSIFDLFVFPSLEEGLGSILLDVMQFRIPIIASNVDGIPDIIQHEHNGLLVPTQNHQQLAAAIARLLNDDILSNNLAEKGYVTAKKYTVSNISEKYIALYQAILKA